MVRKLNLNWEKLKSNWDKAQIPTNHTRPQKATKLKNSNCDKNLNLNRDKTLILTTQFLTKLKQSFGKNNLTT